MNEAHKILEELQTLASIIDGFSKKFDCGDTPCSACPIGPELCLAMNKAEVHEKLNLTSVSRVIISTYWREAIIAFLFIYSITQLFR